MGWGEHHLDAYDPEIGRTRTFTPEELQRARGRSVSDVSDVSDIRRQTERNLLKKLVDLGNKFRMTPIVDDDFPTQRDNFDLCLKEATEYLKGRFNERSEKKLG